LEIARLRFAYIDWLAKENTGGTHILPPIQGHELIRDHGIAAQEVIIAEARLQEAQDGYAVERRLQRRDESAGYSSPLPKATEDADSPAPPAEEEAA
jgi:hypothetical protein